MLVYQTVDDQLGLMDFISHFSNQLLVAGVLQVVAPTASGKTFIGYYVMDMARCLASFCDVRSTP